ncbi:MAG: UDP-N-acetylglucosamine 2-epimerase [Gemmatimonadetes bacterium]|nr:UDP-N-acetylglucosamine 2-epimerase [Gemmatimonadota bacterium]
MLTQALESFEITPRWTWGSSHRVGCWRTSPHALQAMSAVFSERRPDVVVVQGDNSTVLAASLAAHYLGIPVAHVEAGVRSQHLRNPFPEELNRRMAAVIADLHFAPTAHAKENLRREEWRTGRSSSPGTRSSMRCGSRRAGSCSMSRASTSSPGTSGASLPSRCIVARTSASRWPMCARHSLSW